MHRQLAGLGNEQVAFDADKIAVIEQAKQLPAVDLAALGVIAQAGNVLPAHVNLQPRGAVGKM